MSRDLNYQRASIAFTLLLLSTSLFSAACSDPVGSPAEPKKVPLQPKSATLARNQGTHIGPLKVRQINAPTKPARDDFVGAEACGACHAEQMAQWAKSAHGKAGSHQPLSSVIPKFRGQTLTFKDGRVTLKTDPKSLRVDVKIQDRGEKSIAIKATVGRGLMHGGGAQSFFYAADDGRLLLLPFEYNVQTKTWYCQLESNGIWTPVSDDVSLRDCGWPGTRMLGSGPGEGCQNCHGSQITVDYRRDRLGYQTRFTSLSINCESCHGPGRRHVNLMTEANGSLEDIGYEPLSLMTKRESVMVCMACHANKSNIKEGYLSGQSVDDHFAHLLMRHPVGRKTNFDGRVIGFGYQQGHLYSPCYTDGSMTCVDCHGPHGLKYRDIYGRPIADRWSDKQCVDCHPSKLSRNHQGHHADNPLKCTACHMPMNQLTPVGPHVPHARSDHSISIPRPAHDANSGIKSACAKCHSDQSNRQLEQHVKGAYGGTKPHRALTKLLFEYSRVLPDNLIVTGQKKWIAALEGQASELNEDSPIVAVHLLTYLTGELLKQNRKKLRPDIIDALWRSAKNQELDVVAAALTTLITFTGDDEKSRQKLEKTLDQHPFRYAVRNRVMHNLIHLEQTFGEINPSIRKRLRRQLTVDGIPVATERQTIQIAIASSWLKEKAYDKALEFFRNALDAPIFKLNEYPVGSLGGQHDIAALVGATLGSMGQFEDAAVALEKAVADYPYDGHTHARLCQLYERKKDWRRFSDCLKSWNEFHPDFIPVYVRRIELLIRLGRHGEARNVLQSGLAIAPMSPTLIALKSRLP
ncbi:MAG: hypothetical protein VYA30_03595 [Myxococcota bacterium]|nr:hypothetical protein [Myxococcota bacterium]